MKSKALIVEDSLITRRVVKLILSTQNISSVETTNGNEALEVLNRDKTINVAIVDWNMPEMSGIEFTKSIRSNPKFKDLKILMISARDAQKDLEHAINIGVDDFLLKPISKDVLIDKLQMHGLN